MSKIAHYLQEHLVGEVVTSVEARRHFSTDASIFAVPPAIVVYPRNEGDVRKTARFAWQLAERGRIVPITARGSGTDQSGAAIGAGIVLVFPAHLNRIVEFDGKSGVVTVEPGINYGKLQQTLHTHDRFLPPYPSSLEYSTIGGAVANNAGGTKSVKYGDTRKFVKGLRVVLANGEVIETGRLSKRELNKKLGLSTFEGEIYRGLDSLLEEKADLIEKFERRVTKNTAGYNVLDIKHGDGSFDLTPLFVGSQGTLGILTEIMLETEQHNPETTLLVASFDDMRKAVQAVRDLREMHEVPSSMEMIDGGVLSLVEAINPNLLKGTFEKPYPKAVLFVEFDDAKEHVRKKNAKKAEKIFDKLATDTKVETELERQEQLWKIRESVASLLAYHEGTQKAVPVIDDGIVPLDKMEEYFKRVYDLFTQVRVQPAIWGHVGDGNFHMQPHLSLSEIGDRQKVFRLMDSYYRLLIELEGSTSGEMGDGRVRGPYLAQLYGADCYEFLQKVKQIFDPYNTLNPGVKINVTLDDVKPLMRSDYSIAHIASHLPRS
ncbi:MAG TPA: FAD-binding oxidoreductase [Candidatus Saccharimonadales bacterium]|nr:FAD-binding oxidoreductase [Candidatus Saccharimonadales bacterium]